MEPEAQSTWIKRGPHRSIEIRTTPEEGTSIVKRYRARSLWRRLGDRNRAENELRVLRALHEHGLRVPEPYQVRRVGDAWELSCAVVPGARTLHECLRASSPLPVRREDLARRLGTLVGQAHAAGLVHGDLHAGNLLVDCEGWPWLIDFTHARLVRRLTDDVLRRDIIALAADSREFVGLQARRRFLIAWRKVLRAQGRGDLASAFIAQLEDLASARRREVLIEHQDRWTRASGLCEQVEFEGLKVLIARTDDSPDSQRRDLVQACLGLEPGAALPGNEAGQVLVSDSGAHAASSWPTLGRAWQHRLPGLVPLALVGGRRPRALYRCDPGSSPVEGLVSVAELAPLQALLAERGLELSGQDGLWRTARGRLLLGPGCALRSVKVDRLQLERNASHGHG